MSEVPGDNIENDIDAVRGGCAYLLGHIGRAVDNDNDIGIQNRLNLVTTADRDHIFGVAAVTFAAHESCDVRVGLVHAVDSGVDNHTRAEHSGMTKRTLDNQFGSKDQLVVAYLEEREQRWQLLVHETLAAASSPLEAVLSPLEALRTARPSSPRSKSSCYSTCLPS